MLTDKEKEKSASNKSVSPKSLQFGLLTHALSKSDGSERAFTSYYRFVERSTLLVIFVSTDYSRIEPPCIEA